MCYWVLDFAIKNQKEKQINYKSFIKVQIVWTGHDIVLDQTSLQHGTIWHGAKLYGREVGQLVLFPLDISVIKSCHFAPYILSFLAIKKTVLNFRNR